MCFRRYQWSWNIKAVATVDTCPADENYVAVWLGCATSLIGS
jgi:hypothetical protein